MKRFCIVYMMLSGLMLLMPALWPGIVAQAQEIKEADPMAEWKKLPGGLHGKLASIDVRYARQAVPENEEGASWRGVAWRGERVFAQVVLYSREDVGQVRLEVRPLANAADLGRSLGVDCAQAFFVGYAPAEGQPCADILDTVSRVDIPACTVQPVWVQFDIPGGAAPGRYRTALEAQTEGGQRLSFDFEVEVLDLALPPAGEWGFHLDLWQNPFAIARWHHVEPWSPVHFALMEPYYRMLAEAGQKCLTVSLLHKPWGGQTFDPFEAMIGWKRAADGSWDYDFSVFDAYVAFGARCGLDERINCYSMIPWGNRFRYYDEASGDFLTVEAEPGTPEYEALWRPFLEAFAAHCRKKGLLGRVAIAMDERPDELMKKVIRMVGEVAPDLKIASATYHEPVDFRIDDWSVAIGQAIPAELRRARAADPALQTTFYVCCGPERPNTFTFSPPAEAAWLGHYAAAQGLTGFLRWAYCSWPRDPFAETKYDAQAWPAGDCFLVYPGPRSSIRFERLREGIQDFEKIRLLRELTGQDAGDAVREALAELDAALAAVTFEAAQTTPAAQFVGRTQAAIEALSRALAGVRNE